MIRVHDRWWLIAILLLAAIPRLVGITNDALGYGSDEVIYAYDGWSIAETGTDHRQTGRPPLYLKGTSDEWDNRTSVLYPYLIAGISKIVGWPNVLAVRIPAIIGSLMVVWLVFAVARQLFTDPRVARWAGLFAALNPLGALYARNAHDVIFMPLFTLATMWAILATRKRPLMWVLAGCFLALGLYTYQPFKLVGPMVALLTTIFVWPTPRHTWRWMLGGITVGLLIASPFLYTQLTKWSTVQGQFSGISIVGQPHAWAAITTNMGAVFSSDYLFSVRLHLIFVPIFAALTLVTYWRAHRRKLMLLMGWFVVGLGPVFMTVPSPSYLHIHHARALGTLGSLDLLAAAGFVALWVRIGTWSDIRRYGATTILGLGMVSFTIITWAWFVHDQPWLSARPFGGMKDGLAFISRPEFVNRPVAIQQYGTQLSRFVLWQTKFSPREFQSSEIGWGESPAKLQVPSVFGRFRMCTTCTIERPGELVISHAETAPPGTTLYRFKAYVAKEDWVITAAE